MQELPVKLLCAKPSSRLPQVCACYACQAVMGAGEAAAEAAQAAKRMHGVDSSDHHGNVPEEGIQQPCRTDRYISSASSASCPFAACCCAVHRCA